MTESALIAQLLATTNGYLDLKNQALIERALEFSQQAHDGFQRLDGQSYLRHSMAVAQILASWSAPAALVASGLLHDTLKENYSHCPSLELVTERFGEGIAAIIADAAQLGRFTPTYNDLTPNGEVDSIDQIAQQLPWAALVLQRNPQAVVLKIADRLHNLQSVHLLDSERRENFAAITMNIFTSFAGRLGIRMVKRELEDGAFQILQPDDYQRIRERYQEIMAADSQQEWLEKARDRLQKEDATIEVSLAPTNIYTLYRHEIENKRAIPLHLARPLLILATNKAHCYQMLGIAHQLWPPQPGEFRDHIANRRPNGYRALHSRVQYQAGQSLLVIIRDPIMHQVAEEGVVAGWRGVSKRYLPSLPDWQPPPPGKIAVLTPNGDLKHLPQKATPVDFAYAVHPELGHQCIGAVVNGRHHPLNASLKNGDVVKILTGTANVGPSIEWLDSVQTSKAKQLIRQWFDAQKPSEIVERGWQMLNRHLGEKGITLASPRAVNSLEVVAPQFGCASRSELLAAIGLGQRQASDVARQMEAASENQEGPNRLHATIVALHDNHFSRRLAKCCKPQPPDTIVAYTTKKNEMVIHQVDCGRARRLYPLSEARWDVIAWRHTDELQITAIDRVGLVRDLGGVLAEAGVGMTSFHADQMSDGSAKIEIGLGNVAEEALELLIHRLEQVSDVRRIERNRPRRPRRFAERSVLDRYTNNPYTLRPVSGENFYGRNQELQKLVDNLRSLGPSEATVVWGPRRIGKTSLLYQFQKVILAGDNYIPAVIDLQKISGGSVGDFLHLVAKTIAVEMNNPQIAIPNHRKMKSRPLGYFRSFVENIHRFTQQRLVLILDEFQILTSLREESVTLQSVFDYFRALIQHGQGINIVFSGWGTYSSLRQADGASAMLNVTHWQPIGCLSRPEARDLITAPVSRISYDPLAVTELLDITAGHPYFIQMLCRELVAQASRANRDTISQADLNIVLEQWLPEQGEHYFNHFWGADSGMDKSAELWHKLALTAVATAAPDNRLISIDSVIRHAMGYGMAAVKTEQELWQAMQNLVEMDTLLKDGENYCVKVGVCERWLRANYAIPHIIKEMQ